MNIMDELHPELLAPWAVLDVHRGVFRCARCGREETAPPLPMDLDQYVDVLNGFAKRHEDCLP